MTALHDKTTIAPFVPMVGTVLPPDSIENGGELEPLSESLFVEASSIDLESSSAEATVASVQIPASKDSGVRIDTSRMTVKQASSLYPAAVVSASLAVEFGNLERNKVLEPVMSLPSRDEITVVRGHIIVKDKALNNADVKTPNLKSRCVADGSGTTDQEAGNTRAPCVDKAAFFMLLAANKAMRGRISSCDIPSAFLTAPLNGDNLDPPPKPVYLVLGAAAASLLVAATPAMAKFVRPNGTLLFLVKKSIYGLRESPRNFFLHLSKVLKGAKMVQCDSDKCMFEYCVGGKRIYICFWVDDLYLQWNCKVFFDDVAKALEASFGKLDFKHQSFPFLGMYIAVQPDYSIVVDNTAYVKRIVDARWTEAIGAEFKRTRGVLSPSTATLYTDCEKVEATASEIEEYQAQIGELNFATSVRVDIVKEVTFLSTRSHFPCSGAKKAYRQVIAYLHDNMSRPVLFGSEDLTLHVYADASYNPHGDGFGHSGMFITLGLNGGPVFVRSKKHKLPSKSSSESELITVSAVCDEAVFLAKLQIDMKLVAGIKTSFPRERKHHFVLMEDNQSTIFMIKNGEGVGGKAKHFQVRYQFVTDLQNNGNLTVRYCPTEDMIADYLTKGMSGIQLSRQVIRAMYQDREDDQRVMGEIILARVLA